MSMMTERNGAAEHAAPSDPDIEYAVVYRRWQDYEDTVTPVDHPESGQELIADLWNNLGIRGVLTYRQTTPYTVLPSVGDQVQYTGWGEVRRSRAYTVASTCRCLPCQSGGVADRFEIRTPEGTGLSHVHVSRLKIVSLAVTAEQDDAGEDQ